MKINKRTMIWSLALVLAAGVLFAGCGYRPEGAVPEDQTAEPLLTAPGESAVPATTAPPADAPVCTVTFTDGETVLATETVAEGSCPQAAVEPDMGEASFLGWRAEGSRDVVDASAVPVYGDVTYTAVEGPELNRDKAYFAGEDDGLFHPEEEFTRSDAVRVVYTLLKDKPKTETFLNDVTTRAKCYMAASTLATEGWVTLTNGRFSPDVAITMADLKSLLGHVFFARSLEAATAGLGETITRGEAAILLHTLLGEPQQAESAYYPDVAPGDACYAAVSAGGLSGGVNWGDGGKPEPGFIHLDGYLYNVGDDGYFIKNTMVGSLQFDSNGRYTSGNYELDGYVADVLADAVSNSMTREEQLRAVYDYVRDHYLYLKRNLYEVGELGWEIDEALTMYTTGKGNCYNFTAAFWSLTRGIGYESVCLSGLVGVGRDPHSWVEIPIDGTLYIFDPETEMSYRLQDAYWADLYMLTYEEGEYWSYAREPYPEEETAGEPTETE